MGTSKVIYFTSPTSFELLLRMLLDSTFHRTHTTIDKRNDAEYGYSDINIDGNITFVENLKHCLHQILLPNEGISQTINDEHHSAYEIRNKLLRAFTLGFSLRWFSRILSTALSLFVEDLIHLCHNRKNEKIADIYFDEKYLLEGIVLMGGTNAKDQGTFDTKNCQGIDKSDEHKKFGPFDRVGDRISKVGHDNHRIQTLLDLSGAEISVLVAARRISSRDSQNDSMVFKPLTYNRIEKEFETQFLSKRATCPDCYNKSIFYKSFCNLLHCDIIRIAKDHTGGGVFQYHFDHGASLNGIDSAMLRRSPLHFNLDLDTELGNTLKQGVDCSTALRDWSIKLN